MGLPQVVLQYIKKALRRFIGVQKQIEFHLPHHEIPQPSPCFIYNVRTNLMRDFFARKIVVPVLIMIVLIFVTILHWDMCVIVHPGCIWMGQVLVQKIILVINGEHAHNYANLFSKMDHPRIDINVFAMKTIFWNR